LTARHAHDDTRIQFSPTDQKALFIMRKLITLFRNVNRMWLLVALAVVLGLTAAMLMSKYLKGREQTLEVEARKRASGGATVEVVAAGIPISSGTVLGTQNLTKREILADLVTEEMVLVKDFERIEGAKTTRPIQAGWPVRMNDVTEKAQGFADSLQEGLRAITIDVDEINSLAQMVKPGNMVDLMLIVPDKADANGGLRAVLVLQKVKVLATGQSTAPRGGNRGGAGNQGDYAGSAGNVQRYSNFTFEVTPQNAARIALAQQVGKIRAVLRGNADSAMVALEDINTRSMLTTGVSVAMANNHQPRANAVEYIIGGKGAAGAVNINIPSLFPTAAGDHRPTAGPGAAPAAYPPSMAGFMPPSAGGSNVQQRP
jgi:pilus assembly protein CpaB